MIGVYGRSISLIIELLKTDRLYILRAYYKVIGFMTDREFSCSAMKCIFVLSKVDISLDTIKLNKEAMILIIRTERLNAMVDSLICRTARDCLPNRFNLYIEVHRVQFTQHHVP